MDRKFVRMLSTIDCEWEGLSPIYRLYVNDELFAERTWIWNDSKIEENLQVEAVPGEYTLRYELVAPHLAKLNIQNLEVEYGPGEVIDVTKFRILA